MSSMISTVNAPYNTIENRDGVLIAHNTFHAPGGTIHVGGKRLEADQHREHAADAGFCLCEPRLT
jgi:hypothetical protein